MHNIFIYFPQIHFRSHFRHNIIVICSIYEQTFPWMLWKFISAKKLGPNYKKKMKNSNFCFLFHSLRMRERNNFICFSMNYENRNVKAADLINILELINWIFWQTNHNLEQQEKKKNKKFVKTCQEKANCFDPKNWSKSRLKDDSSKTFVLFLKSWRFFFQFFFENKWKKSTNTNAVPSQLWVRNPERFQKESLCFLECFWLPWHNLLQKDMNHSNSFHLLLLYLAARYRILCWFLCKIWTSVIEKSKRKGKKST